MSDAPQVSIVIPTYQRPERLARCLAGIAGLRSAAPFEVVIVDDGGTAPLEPVLAPFATRMNFRLLRQENAGPAGARNRGAHAARGRLLAFIDDDCIPRVDWLTELLRSSVAARGALVGGRTINALPDNAFAQASQDLVSYLYDYYARTAGTPAFFTSNNMLVERSPFLELGGFDATFRLAAGEDRELCDRWVARGLPLHFAADAIIDHFHDLDLRRYSRQHFNYGRGAFHYHAARRARGALHTVEPLSFYTDLIAWPLRDGGGRKLRRALLMALSQAANVAGFFYEKATGAPSGRPPQIPGDVSAQ